MDNIDEPTDSIMIALLPITTDWCALTLPHLTLVYSGKIADHKATDFNQMAKDVSSLALISKTVLLSSMGIDQLGPPEELVSAIMLRPSPDLLAMRNSVVQWNRSDYPTFRPHCTISPIPNHNELMPPPNMLAFNRLMLSWGDEQLVFSLC